MLVTAEMRPKGEHALFSQWLRMASERWHRYEVYKTFIDVNSVRVTLGLRIEHKCAWILGLLYMFG